MATETDTLLSLLGELGTVRVTKEHEAYFISIKENEFIDPDREFVGSSLTEALKMAVSTLLEMRYKIDHESIENANLPAILSQGFIAHKEMYRPGYIADMLNDMSGLPINIETINEAELTLEDKYNILEWGSVELYRDNLPLGRSLEVRQVPEPDAYLRIIDIFLGIDRVDGGIRHPVTGDILAEDAAQAYRINLIDQVTALTVDVN